MSATETNVDSLIGSHSLGEPVSHLVAGCLKLDLFHLGGGRCLSSLEYVYSGCGYTFPDPQCSASSTIYELTEHLAHCHAISHGIVSDQ